MRSACRGKRSRDAGKRRLQARAAKNSFTRETYQGDFRMRNEANHVVWGGLNSQHEGFEMAVGSREALRRLWRCSKVRRSRLGHAHKPKKSLPRCKQRAAAPPSSNGVVEKWRHTAQNQVTSEVNIGFNIRSMISIYLIT